MNKSDLASAIAAKTSISKAEAKRVLDATLDSMKEALRANDKVSLLGFGNFSIVERAERKGVNPATKEEITIKAKKAIKFKAGSDFTASL